MRVLLVPLLVAAVAASLAPAGAGPQNTAVDAVYACPSGSCTKQLSSGDITRGLLRIDVRSDDNLGGLTLIRLEAIGPGDVDWSCIRQFSPGGAKHVQTSIQWSSSHWPFPGPVSGCTESQPHKHGEATLNGSTSLRVVATGSGATQTSSAFTVRLANPPQPPVWRGEPSVSGSAVTLRWYRNPETDVIEYRYVRTDAAGRSKTIAVDASGPTKTAGCDPEKEATFTCVDHPPGGRVRYVLQAFRKSPGGDPRCKTHPEPCVGPASSTAKVVTVASSGSGSTTPTVGPTTPLPPRRTAKASAPGVSPGATGSPSAAADGAEALGDGRGKTPARGGPLALASLALAALLVGHVVAAGRRRS